MELESVQIDQLPADMADLDDWALPKEAFEWIDAHLAPESRILELGSGAGSAIIAKKRHIVSVEHDLRWLNKFGGVAYAYAPLKDGWYDRDAIYKITLNRYYDLIIVDGPVGSPNRIKFLKNFDLFRHNVPILIDDTHRAPEAKMAEVMARELWYTRECFKCEDGKSFCVLTPKNNA